MDFQLVKLKCALLNDVITSKECDIERPFSESVWFYDHRRYFINLFYVLNK